MWIGPSPQETIGAPGAPEVPRAPQGPRDLENTLGHTKAWVLKVAGAKGVRAPGALGAPAGALSI